jgi:hypothetical protein
MLLLEVEISLVGTVVRRLLAQLLLLGVDNFLLVEVSSVEDGFRNELTI